MVRCLIFDVDDTLVEYVNFDFEEWFNFIALPAAKKLGMPLSIKEWRDMISGKLSRRYPEKFGIAAEDFWREVDKNNLKFREFMLREGKLRKYDDCEVIKELNGVKIAWSASSKECVEFVLKYIGFLQYFDGIFGKDYQNYKFLEDMKPNPGLLLEIKKIYGCDKCYVIGDSERDIIAAERAGCIAIFVNRTDDREMGDYTIKSLWELKEVLGDSHDL